MTLDIGHRFIYIYIVTIVLSIGCLCAFIPKENPGRLQRTWGYSLVLILQGGLGQEGLGEGDKNGQSKVSNQIPSMSQANLNRDTVQVNEHERTLSAVGEHSTGMYDR